MQVLFGENFVFKWNLQLIFYYEYASLCKSFFLAIFDDKVWSNTFWGEGGNYHKILVSCTYPSGPIRFCEEGMLLALCKSWKFSHICAGELLENLLRWLSFFLCLVLLLSAWKLHRKCCCSMFCQDRRPAAIYSTAVSIFIVILAELTNTVQI